MCGAEDNKPITSSQKLWLQWQRLLGASVKRCGLCEPTQEGQLPTSPAAVCLPLISAPFALGRGIIRPFFLLQHPLLPLAPLFLWSSPVGKQDLYVFTEAKRNFPLPEAGSRFDRSFYSCDRSFYSCQKQMCLKTFTDTRIT